MSCQTAVALRAQHTGIDADMRARSRRAAIGLIRHWVAESQDILPEDTACPLYAPAVIHQTRIVQAVLIGIGAEFDTQPDGLHRMRLLGINILSDRLDLSIFTAWAEAANIATRHREE